MSCQVDKDRSSGLLFDLLFDIKVNGVVTAMLVLPYYGLMYPVVKRSFATV